MIVVHERFVLVGTSHVADESVKNIKLAMEKYKPEVVGIELDTERFRALMSNQNEDSGKTKNKEYQAIKHIGMFGFLFAKLAGFTQEKIAKSLNIQPGIDMKSAYEISRENKIPVALIDQDIRITLKRLSLISFKQKVGMCFSILTSGFNKEYKKLANMDFRKIPDSETVVKMIDIIKKEAPCLYKVLIADRNKFMCNKLIDLSNIHQNGYIMAVVGAGHISGMVKILKEHKFDSNNDPNSVSFSFNCVVENNEF